MKFETHGMNRDAYLALYYYEYDNIVCSAHADCHSLDCRECHERWIQLPWLKTIGEDTQLLYPKRSEKSD